MFPGHNAMNSSQENGPDAEKPVNPAGSRGLKINAEPVPTAVETLEHLENTLDNLDPVVPEHLTAEEHAAGLREIAERAERLRLKAEADAAFEATVLPPVGEIMDAAADAVIAEITQPETAAQNLDKLDEVLAEANSDAGVEAIEAPAPDDTGSLAEIGHE